MSEMKNILVIGHNGSGKSLLSATLVEDYKAFPISNDVERIYLQDNVKLIAKVKDSYKIFDWEGEPTAMEFQKLLATFDEKIHAILYVIKNGRMGIEERIFMKEIIEVINKRYTGFEKRMILVVTNAPQKLVQNDIKAKEWIDREKMKSNSPIQFFLDANEGDTSRIMFVDNKNPQDWDEEEGDVESSNRKQAVAIYEKINALPRGYAELKSTRNFGNVITNCASDLSKKDLIGIVIIFALACSNIIQLSKNLNSCSISTDETIDLPTTCNDNLVLLNNCLVQLENCTTKDIPEPEETTEKAKNESDGSINQTNINVNASEERLDTKIVGNSEDLGQSTTDNSLETSTSTFAIDSSESQSGIDAVDQLPSNDEYVQSEKADLKSTRIPRPNLTSKSSHVLDINNTLLLFSFSAFTTYFLYFLLRMG